MGPVHFRHWQYMAFSLRWIIGQAVWKPRYLEIASSNQKQPKLFYTMNDKCTSTFRFEFSAFAMNFEENSFARCDCFVNRKAS